MFLRYVLPPVVLFALFVGGWHLAVDYWKVPPYLVPPPGAVVQEAVEHRSDLLRAVGLTSLAAAAAFAASLLAGVLIACVFSQSVLIQRACYPYVLFLQTVPIVAVAPLIITWFGNGFQSIVLTAFIISLFPIVTNTTTGLTLLRPTLVELFELNNASRLQRLFKLQLPNSIPYLVTGARVSAGLCVIGVIVGEYISGFGNNNFGLGYLVVMTANQLKTAYLFAVVVCSTTLGLVLFGLVSLVGEFLVRRFQDR